MRIQIEPIGGDELGNETNARIEEMKKTEELHLFKQTEKKRSALRARYIYGFIFFATNLVAWFVRDYGSKFIHALQYIKVCKGDTNECFHTGGVLRVSFGCFTFFLIMFVTTIGAHKLREIQNSWHSKCWIMKIILYFASLLIPFIIPEFFIQLYGEVARVGAGIFLVLQLISLLEFITWCNFRWMPKPHSKKCGFFGLFLSTISFIASFGGIIVMFILYGHNSSCTFNIFSITWTAILVKVMMGVSLHAKVNEGLLSSGIMGLYIVFLCWSAIQSEPQIGKCRKINEHQDWSTIVGFLIGICSIVMATFSTGIDTKSFQFRKDQAKEEDDIPYNYGIFHFVFAMGSMYFAMLFISWELGHPTRKWRIDVGWASTWIKIINEWFAASIYLWKLISPVINKVDNHNESPHHINFTA